MANTKVGGIKLAARQYGLTVEQYLEKIKTENYCNKCKRWKPRKKFGKDNSRRTGLHKNCQDCRWINGGIRGKPFVKGGISSFKDKKHKPETIDFFKIINKGSGNPNWKGGITALIIQIRNTAEYKLWRYRVYCKDKFTCQQCGTNRKQDKNVILDADHIKALSIIVYENNVKSAEEALLIPEIWDITNGRCLCRDCHKKTDTYGVNLNRKIKNGNK